MDISLTESQLIDTREAMLGPQSDALINLIFCIHLSRQPDAAAYQALPVARALAWVEADDISLTSLGHLVADPIREYRFWIERDRKLHSEGAYSRLAPDHYNGKHVLELGSGFGCNLMSLCGTDAILTGVEPVTVYRQFTAILAEREGLPVPRVVAGRGESLPFDDNGFDLVLCYSSHQYMHIREALREMTRVLKPGGELQIIGGTLDTFIPNSGKDLLSRPSIKSFVRYCLTIANTWSYQLLGRRIFIPSDLAATTAPIYPRYRSMRKWMIAAGLDVHDDQVRQLGIETCFIATKPLENGSVMDRVVSELQTPANERQ